MRLVYFTCPCDYGAALVRKLVQERLAGGGSVLGGVRAIYRWGDAICDESEEAVLVETTADRVEALIVRLTTLHPYNCPKIVAFSASEVLPAYLDWLRDETRPPDDP